MNRVLAFLEHTASEIAHKTARFGQSVTIDRSVLDRTQDMSLATPGLLSANRSCRLIETADAWVAINLPRIDDITTVPALLAATPEQNYWGMVVDKAVHWPSADLIERAELLGLALARVGETQAPDTPCAFTFEKRAAATSDALRVIDFSSLWAGPLCGSVFTQIGADVLKIESAERPDTTSDSAPTLDQRLNSAKRKLRIALSQPEGRARLFDEIACASVLITSARARALEALGLSRETVFAANPSLIWIAITGHSYASARVAFGDDAAASGGLVAWERDEPRFIGDALADPLTGLAAANVALDALQQGQSGFIDAALAKTAAYVAALKP